jgi:hypothetical protein
MLPLLLQPLLLMLLPQRLRLLLQCWLAAAQRLLLLPLHF